MPYNINGSSFSLADPVTTDGTTFVPLADVAEALGGTVEWKHDAKTARVEMGGKVAWIQPDNANVSIDGAALDVKANPYLDGDTLWVPARLFRDGFGANLSVDGSDVTLTV